MSAYGYKEEFAVLAGYAHQAIGAAIARELGVELEPQAGRRYPDGEIGITVGPNVRGRTAVLVQSTERPVGDNLLELLLLADACRRECARSVVAVIPYLGYARQDRRAARGGALGMRVVADVLAAAKFDRVIAVDLHSEAAEGFFQTPIESLTASIDLAEATRPYAGTGAVVVAPDLGAVRLSRELARVLRLPVAILHATRVSPVEVQVHHILGDVRGLRPIFADDMINTGGTIAASAKALLAQGCTPEMTVVATHAVLSDDAIERLAGIGVKRLIVSDTLPLRPNLPFACDVVSIAPRIAEVVRRSCFA